MLPSIHQNNNHNPQGASQNGRDALSTNSPSSGGRLPSIRRQRVGDENPLGSHSLMPTPPVGSHTQNPRARMGQGADILTGERQSLCPNIIQRPVNEEGYSVIQGDNGEKYIKTNTTQASYDSEHGGVTIHVAGQVDHKAEGIETLGFNNRTGEPVELLEIADEEKRRRAIARYGFIQQRLSGSRNVQKVYGVIADRKTGFRNDWKARIKQGMHGDQSYQSGGESVSVTRERYSELSKEDKREGIHTTLVVKEKVEPLPERLTEIKSLAEGEIKNRFLVIRDVVKGLLELQEHGVPNFVLQEDSIGWVENSVDDRGFRVVLKGGPDIEESGGSIEGLKDQMRSLGRFIDRLLPVESQKKLVFENDRGQKYSLEDVVQNMKQGEDIKPGLLGLESILNALNVEKEKTAEEKLAEWVSQSPEKDRAAYQSCADKILAGISEEDRQKGVLEVSGDLYLSFTRITALPAGISVGGSLFLRDTRIAALRAGLSVGGNLTLSFTRITALPAELRVGGDLDLGGTRIAALPEGLSVVGNLTLSGTPITALPARLSVDGGLYLRGTRITALPEVLSVGGDLDLWGTLITALPARLSVGGYLNLSGTPITALPAELSVGGNLNLSGTRITALPAVLSVGGDLDLRGTRIAALPAGLSVGGDLNLWGTLITALRAGLSVGGNLTLSGTLIAALPAGLSVGGNLDLSSTPITALPAGLSVGGNLDLSSTPITALPEGLRVGGNLHLSGCQQLRSLPSTILSLRPPNSEIRGVQNIYLGNTGLTETVLDHLEQDIAANPNSNVQVHISRRAAACRETSNLKDAVSRLYQGVEGEAAKQVVSVVAERLDGFISEHQKRGDVVRYFSRLQNTAEYKNGGSRPSLLKRVKDVLEAMDQDADIREEAVTVLSDAITTCDDRIIVGLNNLEVKLRIREAKRNENPEEALKELAKGMMAVELIQRAARNKVTSLRYVDEIEVYLGHEIKVKNALEKRGSRIQLPISTSQMIFSKLSHITEEEAEQIAKQIEDHVTEERVGSYLKSWEPWLSYRRALELEQQTYEGLPKASEDVYEAVKESVCTISQQAFEDCKNPMVVDYGEGRREFYDYDSFVQWWESSPTSPITRDPISWSQVYRVDKLEDPLKSKQVKKR